MSETLAERIIHVSDLKARLDVPRDVVDMAATQYLCHGIGDIRDVEDIARGLRVLADIPIPFRAWCGRDVRVAESRARAFRDLDRAMRERGLEIREDSRLCRSFVQDPTGSLDMQQVVDIMWQMNRIHGNPELKRLYDRVVQGALHNFRDDKKARRYARAVIRANGWMEDGAELPDNV